MANVFISYARENKPEVIQLREHLDELGHETWVDTSLRGGQDWWEEILRRIAGCDAFIAILSQFTLNSVACQSEFEWAQALGRPLLPLSVERLPPALPARIATLQIADYSDVAERDRAAVRLGGSLAKLPPAPPVPDPLPAKPPAPLSYLTNLVDLVSRAEDLNHDEQRQILAQLERALRSFDPEERRGGGHVLKRLSIRDELFADVEKGLSALRALPEQEEDTPGTPSAPSARRSDGTSSTAQRPKQQSSTSAPPEASTTPAGSLVTRPDPPPQTQVGRAAAAPKAHWALSLCGLPSSIFFGFGLVAIYFSYEVGQRMKAGDVMGATKASKYARIFGLIGITIVLFAAVGSLIGNLSS